MRTTRDIVAQIGPDRLEQMFGVGRKSVVRAAAVNRFTASWMRGVDKELISGGHGRLTEDELDKLFTFKEPKPQES